MKAAILAVGSELLGTDRLDTNSLRLTAALERHGFELVCKSVVGDDEERIFDELSALQGAVDVVLVGGGLGPTRDDLTRQAVAQFAGRDLEFRPELFERLAEIYRRFGREVPETNRQQAEIVAGADVLENPRGTAPGQRLEVGGMTLFLFPGVPHELEGMVERHLEPWLARHGDPERATMTVELRVACLPESAVEERIGPLYAEFGRDDISVLARPGEVRLRLRSRRYDEERRGRMRARAIELVGDALFDDGHGRDLEEVVGRLLLERGETVTTAESCTGGWLGQRFTRIPGSSDWFLGGVVSYTNELKSELLGVPERLFGEFGAVSSPVAAAMAEGARSRLGSSWALSITGVAGPGGGSESKPVGTVHLGLAGADDTVLLHARFPGDRERVRRLSTQLALELLRRRLLGLEAPSAWVEASEVVEPGSTSTIEGVTP